jgi:RNA polymerase sigma-70 factor (ECF subfamily)
MAEDRRKSFENTVAAELPVMYRVARRLVIEPSDAEDLVGQALLLAAKAWTGFDGRHARSWLLKILRNEYVASMRRKAARPVTVPLERADAVPAAPWDGTPAPSTGADLLKELDLLPDEYRLAVALCDMEEMSYAEAAEAMEVPVGTVRSRLYRGRMMLRDRLGDTYA